MSKASCSVELDDLIGWLLDGAELSQVQEDRLQALLLNDPELLDQFVITTALANDLHLVASLAVSADGGLNRTSDIAHWATKSPISSVIGISLVALAASVVLVAMSVDRLWHDFVESPLTTAGQPEFVATVVSQSGWAESVKYPRGSRIPTGRFELEKGVVQLQLDSGPNLFIEGPARLEIKSDFQAHLTFGKLVFRDDSGGDPYLLSTPWSKFVDQGTEYAVSVSGDNEEVHVFSGKVERTALARGDRSPVELLSSGQTMHYKRNVAASNQSLLTAPEKFIRQLDADPYPPEQRGITFESFDYKKKSVFMKSIANGGIGWGSAWRRNVPDMPGHNPKEFALRVGESLVFGSNRDQSHGGSLGYVGHWLTHRNLAEPIDLAANRVVYVSFLYRPLGMWQEGENSLKLMFHNPGEEVIEHRIAIALDAGRGLIRGALCGARKQCPLAMADGETYLIVAKIACSAENPDQLTLRVFQPEEPISLQEPASWTVITPAVDSDDSFRIVSLRFNCEHEQRVDEIRIGDTWSSVTDAWASKKVSKDVNTGG